MKLTQVAAGVAMSMVAATSAYAGNYVQFGFDENEIYTATADGVNNNSVHSYLGFQVMPVENSPLAISGSFNYLDFDSPGKRNDSNRTRTQLFVAYQGDLGNFTFAPKVGFRHHDYADGTRQTV